MLMVVLPWPARVLSPNARVHWRVSAPAKKLARADALQRARAEVGPIAFLPPAGVLPVEITFHPPDRRRRDDDNIIGSLKAARDGIAEALGVDDSRFRCTYRFGDPVPGGRVEWRIG